MDPKNIIIVENRICDTILTVGDFLTFFLLKFVLLSLLDLDPTRCPPPPPKKQISIPLLQSRPEQRVVWRVGVGMRHVRNGTLLCAAQKRK